MENMKEFPEFKARVADPKSAAEQLDAGAKTAEVEVMVAAFDVPDTGQPHGVSARQVIDRGAFRSVIEARNFEDSPAPYYLDHGHAHATGFVDTRLKIGKADKFREEQSGLLFRGLMNLRKEVARDALADMIFDPVNTPHSFRWPAFGGDHTYRGADGFDHVDNFSDIEEVSYCGRGAQMATGILASSISVRAAISPHSTETYSGGWDGSAMVARMPDDASAGMLRQEFAWVDPEGDPATKGSYKFPHHTVENGKVSGANVTACRSIIANLNGARSAPGIPASDRRGVYAHAAKHLRDAGEEDIPTLRATIEEMKGWATEDPEFAAAMRDSIGISPGDPAPGTPRTWLDELVVAEMRSEVLKELARDPDARAYLRSLAEDAEKVDPAAAVLGMYETIWSERVAKV